ncbi:hypothetical protein Dsin_027828 [Dipteronia sinensis]|uniref:Serine-threonine/tyrosine-protein kinase catalytic domain-containing protein n=1 Tax=Dipteronia sinensis TaxID=43782 RepID=A0AAD9ZPP4_9ROSI|nr:hypothetical protein Dsin_027828 [Dipteronia sinensis]
MAPEYAIEGLFSVKSDIFSFGVILLEIISGKRNSGFYRTGQAPTLLAYAWQLWNEGKELEFVDPSLIESVFDYRSPEMHTNWSSMCAGRSSKQTYHVICGGSFGK